MQMPGKNPLEMVGEILPFIWTLCGTLFPVLVAFYRKDNDAMAKLFAAIPQAWDVVQQEQRRLREKKGNMTAAEVVSAQKAAANPLERGVEVAAMRAPGSLTIGMKDGTRVFKDTQLADKVRIELQAYHERMKALGVQATPVAVPSAYVPALKVPVTSSTTVPVAAPGPKLANFKPELTPPTR